eukprot:gnl/Spiro4/13302_TR7071_c0_g1_i1.p1 gnl/Spiro4/13302_TR7071_c0_g1~~gnl/Spiro4/13302_TR7071_c0_g1_i1.p1  ORF type:complete len:832 (+),score=140.81 gnl/Spiro4/13302_TR7071_c0_g1_i1:76-2571(+)
MHTVRICMFLYFVVGSLALAGRPSVVTQEDLNTLNEFERWVDSDLVHHLPVEEHHGRLHPASADIRLSHRFLHLQSIGGKEHVVSELSQRLAKRWDALRRVLRAQPQLVEQYAIDWHGVPEALATNTERYVGGEGFFGRLGVLPHPDAVLDEDFKSYVHHIKVNGESFHNVHLYGEHSLRRLTVPSIPLHGLVLEQGEIVLADSRARVVGPNHPQVSTLGVENDQVGVLEGSRVHTLHIDDYLSNGGDAVQRPSGSGGAEEDVSSFPTTGSRAMLHVRVVFSDTTAGAISTFMTTWSDTNLQAQANDISNMYSTQSYGQLTYTQTINPSYITLSQTTSYYNGNNVAIIDDVRTALSATINNYNTFVVWNPNTVSAGCGLGYVGWSGAWCGGGSGGCGALWCSGHELGHNHGAQHANRWIPASTATPGDAIKYGSFNEYGDGWDMMASGSGQNNVQAANRHYSVTLKRYYKWIADSYIQTVSSSGRYRVYAQDAGTLPSSGSLLGLMVPAYKSSYHTTWGTSLYYMVEVRQQGAAQGISSTYTSMPAVKMQYVSSTSNGDIRVCNGPNTIQGSSCTSGSLVDGSDLVISLQPSGSGSFQYDLMDSNHGRYLTDPDNKVHISYHGSGTTNGISYVDIDVIFGTNNCNGAGTLASGACSCSSTAQGGVDCGVSITSPAANAQVSNSVTISWAGTQGMYCNTGSATATITLISSSGSSTVIATGVTGTSYTWTPSSSVSSGSYTLSVSYCGYSVTSKSSFSLGSSSSGSDTSSSTLGIIIGCSVGGVVLIGVAVTLVWWFKFRTPTTINPPELESGASQVPQPGIAGSVNAPPPS